MQNSDSYNILVKDKITGCWLVYLEEFTRNTVKIKFHVDMLLNGRHTPDEITVIKRIEGYAEAVASERV